MSVGIALFYSGLVKPSNNLYMAWLPLMAGAIATIEVRRGLTYPKRRKGQISHKRTVVYLGVFVGFR